MKEELAKVILDAARIREESYDSESAEKASRKFVNFQDYYGKSIKQAVEEACIKNGIDLDMTQIVYLALDGWWNPAIDWAQDIIHKASLHKEKFFCCGVPIEKGNKCRICQERF